MQVVRSVRCNRAVVEKPAQLSVDTNNVLSRRVVRCNPCSQLSGFAKVVFVGILLLLNPAAASSTERGTLGERRVRTTDDQAPSSQSSSQFSRQTERATLGERIIRTEDPAPSKDAPSAMERGKLGQRTSDLYDSIPPPVEKPKASARGELGKRDL